MGNSNDTKRWLWRIAAAILFVAVVAAAGVLLYPRVRVTLVVHKAQALLDQGKVDEAYFLLLPMAKSVRGNEAFRETYQRALAEKLPLDARKAHQQHAREQKGGKLDEKDVLK